MDFFQLCGFSHVLQLIPPIQRAHTGIFLEQPAEIPLVLVSDHLADLLHGQLRIVGQIMLGLGDPQLGDEFQWGDLVLLLEDLGQVAWAVMHVACDQIQVNIHIIVLDQIIPQCGGNLLRGIPCHGFVENIFAGFLFDLILLPDILQGKGQFFRVDRFQQVLGYLQPNGALRVFKIGIAADDDKFCQRTVVIYIFQQFDPVHDRHPDICDQEIRGGVPLQAGKLRHRSVPFLLLQNPVRIAGSFPPDDPEAISHLPLRSQNILYFPFVFPPQYGIPCETAGWT